MDLMIIALGGGIFLGVMLLIRWLTRRDTRSDPNDALLPLPHNTPSPVDLTADSD